MKGLLFFLTLTLTASAYAGFGGNYQIVDCVDSEGAHVNGKSIGLSEHAILTNQMFVAEEKGEVNFKDLTFLRQIDSGISINFSTSGSKDTYLCQGNYNGICVDSLKLRISDKVTKKKLIKKVLVRKILKDKLMASFEIEIVEDGLSVSLTQGKKKTACHFFRLANEL